MVAAAGVAGVDISPGGLVTDMEPHELARQVRAELLRQQRAMGEATTAGGGALVPQKIDGNPPKGRNPVAKYDADQLKALQAKGHTFPGGTSYPIDDGEDLDNAIHAVGRGGESHDALRKYIIGRAKALGLSAKIPDNWNPDGSMRSDLGLEPSGFIRERFTPSELEIRGDGRSLYGLAVPFDQVATVNDGRGHGNYKEVFKRGSFARTISGRSGQRAKLMANHDSKRFPVGVSTMLREDAAGLVGDFHVSDTRDGNEVIQLVRDGVLDSFSVGFVPVKHERNADGVIERHEVSLREVSVVAFPAYAGATIAGVRAMLDAAEMYRFIELLREDPSALAPTDRAELQEMLDLTRDNESPSKPTEPAEDGPSEVTDTPPVGPTHSEIAARVREAREREVRFYQNPEE